ncbi:hypothetical protein SEA_MACGULLY_100 [Rhodococcus phage MacGully]|nr:hypothetical protein SEA_MACGULLY_100 [Rhodococcus phage MacGully]
MFIRTDSNHCERMTTDSEYRAAWQRYFEAGNVLDAVSDGALVPTYREAIREYDAALAAWQAMIPAPAGR